MTRSRADAVASPAAWVVLTESGSRYGVRRDEAGVWWMSGQNVATEWSVPLADGEWQIREPSPWPPEVGEQLVLLSWYYEDLEHPLRAPGGGKVTSPIVSSSVVEKAA